MAGQRGSSTNWLRSRNSDRKTEQPSDSGGGDTGFFLGGVAPLRNGATD